MKHEGATRGVVVDANISVVFDHRGFDETIDTLALHSRLEIVEETRFTPQISKEWLPEATEEVHGVLAAPGQVTVIEKSEARSPVFVTFTTEIRSVSLMIESVGTREVSEMIGCCNPVPKLPRSSVSVMFVASTKPLKPNRP